MAGKCPRNWGSGPQGACLVNSVRCWVTLQHNKAQQEAASRSWTSPFSKLWANWTFIIYAFEKKVTRCCLEEDGAESAQKKMGEWETFFSCSGRELPPILSSRQKNEMNLKNESTFNWKIGHLVQWLGQCVGCLHPKMEDIELSLALFLFQFPTNEAPGRQMVRAQIVRFLPP